MLAAAYLPEFNDTLMDKHIANLPYTQFPGDPWSKRDSSVALLFELYKQSKNKERRINMDALKPLVREEGYFDFCSGDTKGYNVYSQTYGGAEMCTGFFLMLISKFDNQN